MRHIFLVTSFLFCSLYGNASTREDLDKISSLMDTDMSAAKELCLELKEKHVNKSDSYWHAKSNFYLGYIYKEEGDFGKAIIHYLEAIRYAKSGNYTGHIKDLASLNNRCAIIFRQFKAYDLAEEYYQNGIDLSLQLNDTVLYVNINYNLARTFRDQGKDQLSISLLEKILPLATMSSKKYFDILNRLSNTYLKLGLHDKVRYYSNKIILHENEKNKSLVAYSNHLLGKICTIEKKFNLAEEYLKKTISIIDAHPEAFSPGGDKFEAFVDMGINSQENGYSDKAIYYFDLAENLIPTITQKPEYFELFKSQANLYYELGLFQKSKHYEDLYSAKLNEYMVLQSKIRETDQRYNMELITKRYFAEVDKQERIADILMYSKLTSGGLLTLLLLVIAYHRYQKIMLRRSIERELIALKIVD
ncbi:MAG: tetratricopeptide repeat protein [Cyclobacteriaceae bacterium]